MGWMMIEKDFKTLQLIYMYIYILSLGKKLLKATFSIKSVHTQPTYWVDDGGWQLSTISLGSDLCHSSFTLGT